MKKKMLLLIVPAVFLLALLAPAAKKASADADDNFGNFSTGRDPDDFMLRRPFFGGRDDFFVNRFPLNGFNGGFNNGFNNGFGGFMPFNWW